MIVVVLVIIVRSFVILVIFVVVTLSGRECGLLLLLLGFAVPVRLGLCGGGAVIFMGFSGGDGGGGKGKCRCELR